MRRFAQLIVIIIALVLVFSSCNSKATIPEDDGSMLAAHWDMVLQNDTYLIGDHSAILGLMSEGAPDIPTDVDIKFNLKTHKATPLCTDELCTHEKGSSCKFQDVVSYCFLSGNDLFYRVNVHMIVGTYEDRDDSGNVTTVPVWDYKQEFVRYNIFTGEYKVLVSLSATEAEMTGGRFVKYGNRAYYLRYIPLVEKPQSESDYRLYLCATDLKNGGEERVFEAPAILGESSVLLFGRNGVFFLYDTKTQKMFSVPISDPAKAELLMDGSGEQTVQGGADGIFMIGSYIYYPVDARNVSQDYASLSGFFLYRLNVDTKRYERLSDELVERFNATDDGLVCILSASQLPGYGHENESLPGSSCSPVVRLSLDGKVREYLGFYNPALLGTPFFSWVAGDELFIWCTMSTYRFGLSTGQVFAVSSTEPIPQA